ncbi:MAG: radical SAM protein [Deltaproteobacteria bacterium]|nr:radical SAM protein [Deltaproteobacteria bacterium]
MEVHQINNLIITLRKEGAREFSKVSYPRRYGLFSEIKTPDYIFQFNLNGEIKFIQGLGQGWPDPLEWLKRTVGNDWVFYSTGGYSGVYDSFGEYYLPCPSYPSNSITVGSPFDDYAVKAAIISWQKIQSGIKAMIFDLVPQRLEDFLIQVSENNPETLSQKSRRFHDLIGGRVTVLPPDTRHVDYEVIPIVVADGCLYKCGFCRVKSRQNFTPRTKENITDQIENLKAYYGQDIRNYNAVFLGQHDALNSDPELLEFAARNAYELFEFERSHLKGANLFLFGSVDSILKAKDALYDSLERLPFLTYINIGFESADPKTLSEIKKPITAEMVDEAFARMLEINRKYEKIEITGNFVFGDNLPPSHLASFMALTEKRLERPYSKGAIYFSPLVNGGVEANRGMKRKFYKIKTMSSLPTFIYLIQRL